MPRHGLRCRSWDHSSSLLSCVCLGISPCLSNVYTGAVLAWNLVDHTLLLAVWYGLPPFHYSASEGVRRLHHCSHSQWFSTSTQSVCSLAHSFDVGEVKELGRCLTLHGGAGWITINIFTAREYCSQNASVCTAEIVTLKNSHDDVVEVHCYIVNIGQTECEPIHSRINNN